MKINEFGLEIIKKNEGLRLKAYQDVVGIWTVGYGATGPGIHDGVEWTLEQAEERLRQDLEKFENGVEDLLEVDVNDNQFSALVSLAYNIGLGNLAKSGLLAKVNKEDFKDAANSFLLWNRAGGKVEPGLTKRREQEMNLFLCPLTMHFVNE